MRKLKIVIAEDDEGSAKLLAAIFSKFNHDVIRVNNGLDAVDVCLKNSDVDLVLMDIKMPELNGLDATRKIRQFNPDIIIIAQTAFAQIEDHNLAIEVGCNDYLTKPIRMDNLLKLIKKYFS